jgi:hypothetical protein
VTSMHVTDYTRHRQMASRGVTETVMSLFDIVGYHFQFAASYTVKTSSNGSTLEI